MIDCQPLEAFAEKKMLPFLAAPSSCEPIDSVLYCGWSRRWGSQVVTVLDCSRGRQCYHVSTELLLNGLRRRPRQLQQDFGSYISR